MKKNATKRALLLSALSLLLCVSMLMGTTFAWFTDSVTSASNIIKSGNLDIEMYWADGTKAVPTEDSGWADASKGAIFNYDLWEPGYTQVRHIKIANKGSLALKYQVSIVANGEVSDLANVIDVYYVDPAVQVADRTDLTDANKLGTLTQVLAKLGETGYGELTAGAADTITLAFKMQESAGNEYMNRSIGTDFSVVLMATQLTYESDSFDNQYDNDAENPKVDIVKVPENNTANVELGTETIKVSVPAAAAQAGDVYKVEMSDEKVVTDDVTGETTVAFDLTMYKNDVKVSGDTIYEVKFTIAKGATISAVTHNGVAMTAATTGDDQTYTYDSATGELTIYTKSFSPFAVTYTDFQDFVRKLNRAHTQTSYISVSTGSAFLPVAAVMPEITGYTVFDGDTRIANSVCFRFSKVEKQDIDENSYKVSFELAIKDENGKDLELKPGMPSTINGKEYLHMYVNLLEIPEGYAVSDVKVNGTAFAPTNNAGGNPSTGEYWIGYEGKDVYLQSMETGLFEIIVAKAN